MSNKVLLPVCEVEEKGKRVKGGCKRGGGWRGQVERQIRIRNNTTIGVVQGIPTSGRTQLTKLIQEY